MTIIPIPDLRNVKRVLIIRLSSIGDVTHALPIAAALKDSFPHLELTWLVEEMSADIVAGSPCLDEVLVIPRARWKQGRLKSPKVWGEYLSFLRDLRRRRFDVTLDLQGYAKSALFALATGAPYRLGWRQMRDASYLVSRPLPTRNESVHRVEWFLDVSHALGAQGNPVRFPLHIPDDSRQRIDRLLTDQGVFPERNYAVLNPSSGSPTRRWALENYAALARALAERFALNTVLVGSAKDRPLCERVCTLAQEAGWPQQPGICPPVDLAGQTNLKELAAVLNRATVHVCGDTGSAHIAAALGRPVIALYGPTDPTYAGPWGQSENVLARREFCVPGCGVRQCLASSGSEDPTMNGGSVAKCLAEITVEQVLAKVEQALHGM